MTERSFSIVCLSSQPWSAELPTNRQQIMLRAARRGHRVLFVETGSFLGKHLLNLVRASPRSSLARRVFATEVVAEGIEVRKAFNLMPWGHKYRFANRVNCALTNLVLRRRARSLPPPVVLWIYDPCTTGCTFGEEFAVYDCVDDYPEQAGSDRRRRTLVAEGDERSASRSRLVFATVRPLLERHRRRNPQTHLVGNAADYEHFAPASDPSTTHAGLASLRRPVIGFAGNFSGSKVDLELVEKIALLRPDWTFLLVGPARAETDGKVAAVAALRNVEWVGAKPYDELPGYVAAFDVGLIPYVANDYTRSCFPLKLYEYLAAGKPVVATGLPELAGMEPDVVLADGDPESVVAALAASLGQTGDENRQRRMAIAAANTWETRAGRLLELVSGELSRGP